MNMTFLYQAAKHQCKSPWIERNGACFKLFTDKASWSDALETCQLHSATLVYLENSQENEFVHGSLSLSEIK